MYQSTHRLPTPRIAVAAGLLCLALPATGLVQSDDLAPLARAVFPVDRESQDARLHRPARTTDSEFEWVRERDPVAWEQRAKEVATRTRVALGLWPHPSAGLERDSRGRIERDGYVIEKMALMTHWYYFIPANVYWPTGAKAATPESLAPMIIMPCGEWDGGRLRLRSEEDAQALIESGEERELQNARRPYQALGAQLARMGCVVIQFDVTASGEADGFDLQTDLRSVERIARCQDVLAWRVWDTMMGLNHIWNIEGVDQSRAVFIGNMAGAQLNLLLGLQEARTKYLVLLNYLSQASQGVSLAENSSHLRVGTSNIEMVAALAPRALYIASTGVDACGRQASFTEELAEHWATQGAPDAFEAWCYPERQEELGLAVREGIYGYLNRVLDLGLETPIIEQPIDFIATSELTVYGIDRRTPSKSEKTPKEAIETFSKLTDGSLDLIVHEPTPRRAELLEEWMGAALKTLIASELPEDSEVASRLVGYQREEGRADMRLVLGRAGSGEEVPAVLTIPDEWNGTVLVGVSGGGKHEFFGGGGSSTLSGAASVLDMGAAFLSLDVLLTGESANERGSLPVDRRRHEVSMAFTAGYNRTLIGERVHDILTALAFAHSLEGAEHVHLVGTGEAGPWALMAHAIAGDMVERTAVQWSWEFADITEFDDPNFLPGGVRYGDTAYFASLVAPSGLCLMGAPGEAAIGIPEHVLRTYEAYGTKESVRTAGSTQLPQVYSWLGGADEQ